MCDVRLQLNRFNGEHMTMEQLTAALKEVNDQLNAIKGPLDRNNPEHIKLTELRADLSNRLLNVYILNMGRNKLYRI